MKGWDELHTMDRVERLREVLEDVLKDLHYARGLGLSSTAAMKLSLLEKDESPTRP